MEGAAIDGLVIERACLERAAAADSAQEEPKLRRLALRCALGALGHPPVSLPTGFSAER
eukprot:SAG11_NODE_5547_length_1529_cov_4.364336_2_plen_59_part_00